MWHAEVGAFCSISWNEGGGANHDNNRVTAHVFLYSLYMGLMGEDDIGYERFSESCTIGNNVWIGDGAVVGTGSVVTHDVEPYTIVADMSARTLKH